MTNWYRWLSVDDVPEGAIPLNAYVVDYGNVEYPFTIAPAGSCPRLTRVIGQTKVPWLKGKITPAEERETFFQTLQDALALQPPRDHRLEILWGITGGRDYRVCLVYLSHSAGMNLGPNREQAPSWALQVTRDHKGHLEDILPREYVRKTAYDLLV